MDEGRTRAAKLPRYGLGNVAIDREGADWMDGIASLDIHRFPLFRHNIPETHLTLSNLPPFYRVLSNTQANSLARWAAKGNLSRENLGHYWPGNFNADGKIKRGRLMWEIGPNEPPARPFYRTNLSSGRPMKAMEYVPSEESGDENSVKPEKTGLKRDTPASPGEESGNPGKLILLHDSKDTEKIYELQCEIDTLRASLKLAQAKYDGLQAQMSQVESALSIRSNLVTNAIVSYYFAYTNIRLLSPSIASLVDETVSPDDISLAAGGVATLDHRVKVVKEIAQRLSIPISIDPDIVGTSEEGPSATFSEDAE